ncbi:hypothetical protein DOTSEDRAFT_71519 [Dothistroma septosporum NZE10]|uniref:Uncharacterized protein n=1 Tax=Dothistroma septosporum (strain NZE10 / CBS 128990) TaxID=675120 RepID=N1PQX1_DOTSN|nr:hypothetical protein DOTSEDRAFT_71519 [Dothistroma septosporum NZE10]
MTLETGTTTCCHCNSRQKHITISIFTIINVQVEARSSTMYRSRCSVSHFLQISLLGTCEARVSGCAGVISLIADANHLFRFPTRNDGSSTYMIVAVQRPYL